MIVNDWVLNSPTHCHDQDKEQFKKTANIDCADKTAF